MDALATQLRHDMLADSREYTSLTKTNPSRYLQMLHQHGPVETARRLSIDPSFHEGFTRAWEHGCLKLTVEYLIVYGRDGAYHSLFDQATLASAKHKLAKVGVTSP